MRERSLQNYLVKKIRNKKIRNDQCITIKRMIKQIIVQCFKKLGTDKHIVMLSF